MVFFIYIAREYIYIHTTMNFMVFFFFFLTFPCKGRERGDNYGFLSKVLIHILRTDSLIDKYENVDRGKKYDLYLFFPY
jgi:hypothetical protein